MGFTLPRLDVPVVKITNCLLAPSVTEMGAPQEEKAVFVAALALTLALPTFYRSSFIGSAKGSSMTRLPLTILLIV